MIIYKVGLIWFTMECRVYENLWIASNLVKNSFRDADMNDQR